MAFTRPKASQINFDVTNISDPLVRINSGQTGSADKDSGIVIERGDDTNVAIIYDESADKFVLINTTETGTTSGNVTISSYADLVAANITVYGDILPDADNTRSLGSASLQWQDVYVGPGSLYVNGRKVLEEDAGTMIVSSDEDQSVTVKTSGTGVLTLQSATTINVSGTLQVQSGNTITDSAGAEVNFGDPIDMNSNKILNLGAPSSSTDAATKGYVDTYYLPLTGGTISSNLTVSGNFTVSGTTTTVNTETISLADNIIDLNSNFTSGAPTENAGIRIIRGDSNAVLIRWNETNDKWELTTDGSSYTNIAVTSDISLSTLGVTASAAELNLLDGVTATTAEINYLDGVTSAIQTQIDNISSSFTLSDNQGTPNTDTFTTGQTLTFAGSTGIDTTVSDNQVAIAIDSTVATLTGSQTLTNKTLTAPVISSITNTGTLTLPTTTGTVALTSDISLSTLSITASAVELNLLDGVTATTAELNYVDGVTSNIQTQLDGKQASGSYLTGNETITLSGDVSGSGTTSIVVTITDDSHNHIISNVDGLQDALDAKLASASYTAADVLSKLLTVDGAGSGLDADTLDGVSSASFATITGSETLTNKTLTAPVISSITNTGTLTLPTSTGTVALTSDITLSTLSVTSTAAELNLLDGVTATTAELNYVDGVTSNIQTQLDAKAPTAGPTFTGTLTYATLNDGTTALTSTVAELNVLDGITATTAELNYTDGVTSNIQTQLDAKAPLASPAFTGTATGVNLALSGTLTVNGTTTTVNTDNLVVKDNLIELNNGASTNANDSGIVIERGSTGDNAFIGWDESEDKFIVGTTLATGASTGDLTITTGTLVANVEGNLTGNVTGNVTGSSGSTTGNAATATALQTARTIAGVSFDGTANITIASTDLSDTSSIVLTTASQTLTNKTLTAPVISSISNTGTLTLPTSTGTVALTSDISLSTLSVTSTADELNILDGVTATTAELNYTDGVTSNIQTQLDAKAPTAGPTFTGTVTTSAIINMAGSTTEDVHMEVGTGRSGNGNSYIDLIGDATYTDYGMRLQRYSTGANAASRVAHRGTGGLSLWADDAGYLQFGTNNAERMRIDSSGNVGIGTSSPSSTLHVSGGAGSTIRNTASSGSSWFVGTNVDSYILHNESNTPMTFTTNGTERMRIDSSGNVGIGTSSPSSKLTVQGTITIGSTGHTYGAGALGYSDANWGFLYRPPVAGGTAAHLFESYSGNNLVEITEAGNVGIGITPSVKLHVSSGATNETARFEGTGNPYISIYDTGVRSSYWLSDSTAVRVRAEASKDFDIGTNNTNVVTVTTNNTERMRITSGGGVGIGTSSPKTKLDVFASSVGSTPVTSADDLLIEKTGDTGMTILSTTAGRYAFGDAADPYIGGVIYDHSNDAMTLYVNNADALTINSSGNVGIGTTVASLFNGVGGVARLTACGSDTSTNVANNSSASIAVVNTDTTAGNTAAVHFARADTDDTPNYAGASIVAQFPETQVTGQYPKGLLAFLTSTAANFAPSEKMRIDASGNVGIGTSSVTNKLDVSGNIGLLARGEVRLYDTDSSNYIALRASGTVTSNLTFSLPTAYGDNGQVLTTDGAGGTSWTTASGGGGGSSGFVNSTTTTVPASSGNYDLAEGPAQDGDETPFESGAVDAFDVNLGTIYDCMEPVGSLNTVDYGDSEAYVGA